MAKKYSWFLVSLAILYFLLFPSAAWGDYPVIRELSENDLIFLQIQGDIKQYYQAAVSRKSFPALQIFSYSPNETTSLFAIASRINLPYETISTLNGLESPEEIPENIPLLIPNIPGLFIPAVPQNDFELLLSSHRRDSTAAEVQIKIRRNKKNYVFLFIPGLRFSKLELAYFLGLLFRFPLPSGQITSLYGPRNSPINGQRHFHEGIDIAAHPGTDVYAAREGSVFQIGTDPVLGRFIILSHEGGYQTVYAHLEKQFVALNQSVYSGMIIGVTGNTGLSTGPHLHFEIRNLGENRDPIKLLSRASR